MAVEEEVSAHSKEVAKGSFWGLAGNIFFKLISFFYVVLIARMVSQDDIGLFELAFSILSFLAIFSDLGISTALKRYIPYFIGAGELRKIRDLLGVSTKLMLLSGVAVTLLVLLLSNPLGDFYQNPRLPEALFLLMAFILLNNLQRQIYVILAGFMDVKRSQLVNNVQNFSKLLFSLVLFHFFGATLLTLSAGFIISFIPAIVIGLPAILRQYKQIPVQGTPLSSTQLKEILPFGLILSISTSLSVLVSSSGLLILGYLTEPAQANTVVAIYSLSITLSTAIGVFAYSVGGILFPMLSKLIGKNDLPQTCAMIGTGQRWCIFVTFPAAIALTAFSTDVLRILYGNAYVGGAIAMSIFNVGMLIGAIYYPMLLAIAALRMIVIELRISMAAAVVNVLLALILIPHLGMAGAALASVIGFTITLLMSIHYSKSLLGYSIPKESYQLILAGLIALVIALFIRSLLPEALPELPGFGDESLQLFLSKGVYLFYIIFLVAASGALFVFFALLLKCFHTEDIILMKKAMRKARMPDSLVSITEKIASYGVAAARK